MILCFKPFPKPPARHGVAPPPLDAGLSHPCYFNYYCYDDH